MEYRQLGRTGTRVSELCLGTMTFGNEADETTSRQIVDRFVDAGGNFIDTANVYSQGVSEEITGRAIAGKRDQIVRRHEGALRDGRRHERGGLVASQPARRVRGVAASPRHRVDRPLPGAHVGPAHAARGDALDPRRPRARGQGALHRREQLRRLAPRQGARRRARCTSWEPFVCLQPEYSLITRDAERELIPLCQSEGLAVIPWSPLGGGILTGKYAKGADFPTGTRGGDTENPITFTYRLDDRAWSIVDAVKDAAEKTGKSAAQISLNWVANRRGVTAPIIGARNLTQLEDNLGAVGWQLDDETGKALSWASAFRLGYPYEFIQYAG